MIDTENETLTQEQRDKIIHDLNTAGRRLPAEAIEAARHHKAQIIPELSQVLHRAAAALRDGKEWRGDAPFFALFLLAEFRASEGLPAILDALTLPGQEPFDLFGDAITEYMPRILLSLARERVIAIGQELFRNKKLDAFVRGVGPRAIVHAAVAGFCSRAEAVEICRTMLIEAIAEEDVELVTSVVMYLLDLHAVEANKEMEDAFDRELVDDFMVDRESAFSELRNPSAQPASNYSVPPDLNDTMKLLESWQSFNPVETGPIDFDDEEIDPVDFEDEEMDPYDPPSHSQTYRLPEKRVGRNDPCPCGSGKKFKRCCGGRR